MGCTNSRGGSCIQRCTAPAVNWVASRGRDSMPTSELKLIECRVDHDSSQRLAGSVLSIRRSIAVWIWTALLIADAILIARRLSGGLEDTIPPVVAVTSTAIFTLISFAGWLVFRSCSTRELHLKLERWIPLAISITPPLLWSCAIVGRVTPSAVGILAGIGLLQWLAAQAFLSSGRNPKIKPPPTDARWQTLEPASSNSSTDEIPGESEPAEMNEEWLGKSEICHPDELTQWITRKSTDEADIIEGWIRADFAAGQREVIIHVSFCPPLAGLPQIETEDLDGSELEIRVSSIFAFGARLTARRSGRIAENHSARIGFVASATADRRAA